MLLAARNPLANRSLIAFTAWLSIAHAAVMVILELQTPSGCSAVALLGGIGVLLIVLAPATSYEATRLIASEESCSRRAPLFG